MAHINSLIATLAPQPVAAVLAETAFKHNVFFNVMDFATEGGISYTFNRVDGSGLGDLRNPSLDWETKNAVHVPTTVYMCSAGGKYSVSNLSMKTMGVGLQNRDVQRQMKVKVNNAKNRIIEQFIAGTGADNGFKGINAICTEFERVINSVADFTSNITKAKAEAFLEEFTDATGKLNVAPNVIFCSRELAAKLKTIAQLTNQYVMALVLNTNVFMFGGIAVVEIDKSVANLRKADGTESYFIANISEEEGLYLVLPDENVLNITEPAQNTAKSLWEGSVETLVTLAYPNTSAVIRVDNVKMATV